ncbi:MAG: short-chain dehydrogenase, partial [Hydrogenophaga sp.]
MNPKIENWSGQRVWLVGASAGIGAALAKALAERGAQLALSSRKLASLEALQIPGAVLLPCDSTQPD